MECEVCGQEIDGEVFTLSALTEEATLLRVCRTCAGSQWITIQSEGIEVVIFRDDYIRANKERLDMALDKVAVVLEDLGWESKAIKLEGKTDDIMEEYEE